MEYFDNIEEELESMEPDELVAYAAYMFEVPLSGDKPSEILVEEIMVLFEQADTK